MLGSRNRHDSLAFNLLDVPHEAIDIFYFVVLEGGQFTPTARAFKGPQGVWIQAGKLFVADTGNDRVLIWNSIPTSNFQPANVVLGQPNFTTFGQPDLTKTTLEATATSLLTPVSVTSDGQRLYVTDLGNSRVLIWNTIPTRNQEPADVVLGQATMIDVRSPVTERNFASLIQMKSS